MGSSRTATTVEVFLMAQWDASSPPRPTTNKSEGVTELRVVKLLLTDDQTWRASASFFTLRSKAHELFLQRLRERRHRWLVEVQLPQEPQSMPRGRLQELDCDRNVRLGSFCSAHSSAIVKKICEEEGCTNVAHNRQRCVRHGGGRKCKIQGCKTHARSGGYCCRHSHKEAISPLSILTDSAPDIDVNLTPADEWKFWQELSFDGLPTADESMAKALTHSIDIISVIWDDFMSSAPDEMFAVDQCNYS
ncbi:hypothetical protein LEN26_014678 [Aphanomyces euteiches]|nr:hypothetical protein LEN26_014678 [Aphanomyces euteiches]KAH9113874.1 hypothetical protein AeMF1_012024 [Aphanomyces euteiches]KAH9184606.1 hypothetical protein AeNC1_013417 [Aphanomyces euteiches]